MTLDQFRQDEIAYTAEVTGGRGRRRGNKGKKGGRLKKLGYTKEQLKSLRGLVRENGFSRKDIKAADEDDRAGLKSDKKAFISQWLEDNPPAGEAIA